MINENDVIAGLHNGDSTALKKFLEEYGNTLIQFGKTLNDDEEEVKDAVAYAFLKLWEARLRFNELKNIKAYLYVIVRNKIFDQLRQRKKEMQFIKSNHIVPTDERKYYEEIVEMEEMIKHMHAVLETLDSRDRQILLWSMKGMKSKDIGEKLGMNEGAVNTRKRRALIEMKEKINKRKKGWRWPIPVIIALLKLI